MPWIVGAALVALPFVYHAPYPLTSDRDRPDLVVDVHVLVGDGTLRPGLAGSRRLHGDRCVCHRIAVEPFPSDAVDRHSDRRVRRRRRGAGDRVAVLPVPHRGPLLRPGDAGAQCHRAAGDHRDAGYHRRFTRLYAAALQRRQFHLCAAVHRQGDLVSDSARGVGRCALYPPSRRAQHVALCAGGDRRGRGCGGSGGRVRDMGETEDHAAQRNDDRVRRARCTASTRCSSRPIR